MNEEKYKFLEVSGFTWPSFELVTSSWEGLCSTDSHLSLIDIKLDEDT